MLFDIYTIIFLALLVFIFLRLRSVLGQRTGRERPPYDPYSARDTVRTGRAERGRAADREGRDRVAQLRDLGAVDITDAPREGAPANPDDVDAQTLVADLDLLGGHVDDSFSRLVALVQRMAGDERNRAREHLLGLFAAVGNDDPRVLRGRQSLASALF